MVNTGLESVKTVVSTEDKELSIAEYSCISYEITGQPKGSSR
jgi:hypothetical protein